MAEKILAGIEAGGLGTIDVAETVESGDLVGYSAGWKLAKQAAAAIPAIGVVDRAKTYISGGDNKVQLHTRGIVRGASGLTPGAPVYLAEGGEVAATAGANFAQMVGIALSATDWVIAINAGVGSAPSAHIVDTPATTTVDAVAVPVGGVGAAAGGWDTAANRDLAITRINDMVTLANELKADYNDARAKINTLLVALEAHGIVVKA